MYPCYCQQILRKGNLGRPWCRCEDNIKRDVIETEVWEFIELDREGASEGGNKRAGSIKCMKLLDRLSDYQLVKDDCQIRLVGGFFFIFTSKNSVPSYLRRNVGVDATVIIIIPLWYKLAVIPSYR